MPKILILFFSCLTVVMSAQNVETRNTVKIKACEVVPADATIRNIFVDQNNTKWVATNKGVYKLFSNDNGAKQSSENKSWELLRFRDGNKRLSLPKDKMTALFKSKNETLIAEDRVTTSFFDKRTNDLWVGTSLSGVYQFKVKGNDVKLANHYTTKNSKLKSNEINTIFIDHFNRLLIGTTKGILYRKNGKLNLYQPNYNIIAVTAFARNLWVLSEDILWQIDSQEQWIPRSLDQRFIQGKVKDIAYDRLGRLWVASDILVRFDVKKDIIEKFTNQNSSIPNNINTITIDKEDQLWIGTTDQGIFIANDVIINSDKQEEVIAAVSVKSKETDPLSVSYPKEIQLKCGNDFMKLNPIQVTGGKPPYHFKWSDPKIEGGQLRSGSYRVTITDSGDNLTTRSFKISINNPLRVEVIQKKAVSTKSAKDGAAIAEVEGGKGIKQWKWDNGETKDIASKLSFGKHTVTVTDENGCTLVGSVSIATDARPTPDPKPAAAKATIPGLTVKDMKKGQTIQLKKLYFKANSKDIEPPSLPTLDEVYNFLRANPKVVVEVGGHTNGRPSHEFCDKLSTERAQAVSNYLIKKGITKSRVVFKGYGKREPLTTNKTTTGRKKNQRVELKILSLGN